MDSTARWSAKGLSALMADTGRLYCTHTHTDLPQWRWSTSSLQAQGEVGWCLTCLSHVTSQPEHRPENTQQPIVVSVPASITCCCMHSLLCCWQHQPHSTFPSY